MIEISSKNGLVRRKLLIFLIVIAFFTLLVAIGPSVLDRYTVNILIRSFLYATVVLTVDLLWGYTGILSFGQSALFAVGAYSAGLMFTHLGFGPIHAVAALFGGIFVAMIVGWLVGWISFWHRATPFYVAVITLVLPIIVVQLLYSNPYKLTGSSSGLVGFQSFFLSVQEWFWIAGGVLIFFSSVAWLFVNSNFGRVLIAIRENEDRCRYLGINTIKIKTWLFIASAAIAAVAGYCYAGFTVVVAPEIAGFVFGTELVIYNALGGRGTLIGPVIGAVLIDLSSAYLSGNLPYVWKLIIGSIFVAVILFIPQGVAPLIMQGMRFIKAGVFARAPQKNLPKDLPELILAEYTNKNIQAIPLRVESLSRNYGSLRVLTEINLEVRKNEIVSIVGPNGAGKTTLMRCISNGHEPTEGVVWVNGVKAGKVSPHQLVELGIGRSFQNTSLFAQLTVADCLRLARHRADAPSMFLHQRDLNLPESTLRILKATELDKMLNEKVSNLSHGLKRALELAMVLATEPSVLLLDEPTAGLTKSERTLIASILTDLRDFNDLCILLIEHDLDFVRDISSRIVVLHQGKLLLDGTVDEVVSSELVRSIYSGEQIAFKEENA